MDTIQTLINYRDQLQKFITEGVGEYVTRDYINSKHNKTRGNNKFTVQYKMDGIRLIKLQNELKTIQLRIDEISVNL